MNELVNIDCMKYMSNIIEGGVTLTLTDIPYGEVNRSSNGLRSLDKSDDREKAEEGGARIKCALGSQISWYGVREKI